MVSGTCRVSVTSRRIAAPANVKNTAAAKKRRSLGVEAFHSRSPRLVCQRIAISECPRIEARNHTRNSGWRRGGHATRIPLASRTPQAVIPRIPPAKASADLQFPPTCPGQEVKMVSLVSLWLPILLAAVIVFFLSWLIHMLLPFHRGDFRKVPSEDEVMDSLRRLNIPNGE